MVAPLTSLIGPLVPLVWSEECEAAFVSVKALLCSSPVLAAPDYERPFTMEVEASALCATAVLAQEDADGLAHPVCYFSQKCNSCQTLHSTIKQETLALLLAPQFF